MAYFNHLDALVILALRLLVLRNRTEVSLLWPIVLSTTRTDLSQCSDGTKQFLAWTSE